MKRSHVRWFIIIQCLASMARRGMAANRKGLCFDVALELDTGYSPGRRQLIIPGRTMQRDLKALIDLRVVRSVGRAKATRYLLSEPALVSIQRAEKASEPDRKQWARWDTNKCGPGHSHPLIEEAIIRLIQGELRGASEIRTHNRMGAGP